jgi:hypothetical protein
MHYGLSVGTHRCVRDLFREASARLRSLSIVQPVPQPASRSPLETPEQVVDELNETIQHRPDETVLGEDTEITQ